MADKLKLASLEVSAPGGGPATATSSSSNQGAAAERYSQRRKEVEQKPNAQLTREESLWKLDGFPLDAMPAQGEGDSAPGATTAAEAF